LALGLFSCEKKRGTDSKVSLDNIDFKRITELDNEWSIRRIIEDEVGEGTLRV